MSAEVLAEKIRGGAKELWRGLSGNHEETTARVEEFKQGRYFAGQGIYGSGTYSAGGPDGRTFARGYASSDQGLMHLALSCTAKTIENAEIVRIAPKIWGKLAEIRQFLTEPEKTMANLLGRDYGVLASLLGYDAVHVTERDFTIILDRSKVFVEE